MRRMGIDPSVASSGYAVKDDNGKIIAIGKITTDKKLSELERLSILYDKVKQLVQTYNVAQVIFEDQFIDKNAQTGLYLARARAIAQLAAFHAGAEVIIYSPKEIKKVVAGKGNANKKAVQEAIIKIYGQEKMVQQAFAQGIKTSGKQKNDDISDALAILYTHETLLSGRSAS